MTQDKSYSMNLKLLQDVIGSKHSIAIADWADGKGTVWQVMPDSMEEQDFFNWYCHNREDDQYFQNIHECVTTYIHYRNKWISMGRPKPY